MGQNPGTGTLEGHFRANQKMVHFSGDRVRPRTGRDVVLQVGLASWGPQLGRAGL